MQARMNEGRPAAERPLGELFGDLASETSNLVRSEIALAKVELTQNATKVGRNIGSLVVGGAIAYAALLALLAAAILALDMAMPAWIAALIVGLLVGGIAWLLIGKALTELRNTQLTPRESVESLKEDAQWIKDQVS
ncbi:MAG TPA: phage holin family protein [Pyrinomonadaceae bacterium]|nr:phage holin family protein [Pyrinomonadaceae bacterium]